MEGLLDPETHAVVAIDAAMPYVSSLGQEVAKSVAAAAGKSISGSGSNAG